MSDKNQTSAKRQTHRSKMSRRIWIQYILSLIAWAVAVLILAVLAWTICREITWFGNELLYPIVHWAAEYVVFLYGIVTMVGWLVISYIFISMPLRYLDDLVAAAGELAHPKEDAITLPPAMESVEAQLNLVREQALRDAQTAKIAEQRKNDLIVYLAHDLKTPLTSVIGYLTLLRDEPQISPEIRTKYTGIALEKAERLEDLINEFFEITRFNLSHLELEKQPVDLTRMLQQIISEFQPMLQDQNLTCQLNLPLKLEYNCDPDKLARVFDNLLRNACHYSLHGSAIRITGTVESGTVVLTFVNSGRTIPPEKLKRIFDQFFRLDTSRATRTGGAGLGLAIAKEIVELHGGTITAHSADNQVAFTIRLPFTGTTP